MERHQERKLKDFINKAKMSFSLDKAIDYISLSFEHSAL